MSPPPYKMAFGLMPSQAASCPDAKQQYINGHFCYTDKFAILTNGLGIVRHIAFLDDEFKANRPEMPVEKKSDSPDEDKSIGDSFSLKPVLSDFFSLHPVNTTTRKGVQIAANRSAIVRGLQYS